MSTEVHLAKALVFPVVVYECESWTIKKAECWRIDAFELWCWRRLLRVPWTARRSNLSILREINLNIHWKDWHWSWSSNTLATWCEELTHWKRPWCQERLRARAEGVAEDKMVGWLHQLNGHEFEQLWETVKDRKAWHAAVHRVTKSLTRLSDWTTRKCELLCRVQLEFRSDSTRSLWNFSAILTSLSSTSL